LTEDAFDKMCATQRPCSIELLYVIETKEQEEDSLREYVVTKEFFVGNDKNQVGG